MYFTIGGMKIKIIVDEIPEECNQCPLQVGHNCLILNSKPFEGHEECPLNEEPEAFLENIIRKE